MVGRLHLSFRPLGRPDYLLLAGWLAAPHVRRWWREDPDLGAIEERYGPAVDGTDPTELFIVDGDAVPIGFVQRYRLDDNPQWRDTLEAAGGPRHAAGVDYLIGPEELIGKGLGPEIIDLLVEDTWTCHPELSAVVVSVAEDNIRSWRALEKAHFGRVWSGPLVSDDPSDSGVNHVYVRRRPRR